MDFSYIRPDTISSASVAARTGDLEGLTRIVSSSSGDDRSWLAVDNRGWGPLHHAAYNGHSRCVQYLGTLECINVNAKTWEGETPLFLACKNLPVSQQAVHALLKLKANVNITTNEKCSPLQYAAVKNDDKVVKWLVRTGARVNHCNVWGESPLHTVMRRTGEEGEGRINIVKYLLKHEAIVICCDSNNLTPLMLASMKGFVTICELLITHDSEDYSRIVSHVNLRAEDGATALMMAAQAGRLECVQLLLNFGADPDIAADDGTMAVHLSCISRQNSPAILEKLLPVTNHEKLSSACNIQPPDPVPRVHDKKVLSPFKLAIEWENWDSLDILMKNLDVTQFYAPLQFCFIHKDLCPDDRGFCDLVKYRFQNPLSSLLSERMTEKSLSKLKLFVSIINDSKSLPPLVTLLTTNSVNIHTDAFNEGSLHGKAFSYLVSNGATVTDEDILPILLFGTVSGLFRLISSGIINPFLLVENKFIEKTRNILMNDFSQSTQYQMFEMPLISQRLLNVAIIATFCSLLDSDWVQNLALLVIDQLQRILNISHVVVIDKMYKNLKCPKKVARTLKKIIA